MLKTKYYNKIILILILLIGIAIPVSAAEYTYDNLGRLTSVKYDNGQRINYAYDAGGNLLRVTQPDSTPPKVVSTEPISEASEVAVDKELKIFFNERVIQGVYFNDITITNNLNNTVIDYTYSLDNHVLTIDPVNNLDYGVTYTVNIPTGTLLYLLI